MTWQNFLMSNSWLKKMIKEQKLFLAEHNSVIDGENSYEQELFLSDHSPVVGESG